LVALKLLLLMLFRKELCSLHQTIHYSKLQKPMYNATTITTSSSIGIFFYITFLKKVKQKSNKTNGRQLLFVAHATLSLSQQFHHPTSQGVLFLNPIKILSSLNCLLTLLTKNNTDDTLKMVLFQFMKY
jgi:hypothetical protein